MHSVLFCWIFIISMELAVYWNNRRNANDKKEHFLQMP